MTTSEDLYNTKNYNILSSKAPKAPVQHVDVVILTFIKPPTQSQWRPDRDARPYNWHALRPNLVDIPQGAATKQRWVGGIVRAAEVLPVLSHISSLNDPFVLHSPSLFVLEAHTAPSWSVYTEELSA